MTVYRKSGLIKSARIELFFQARIEPVVEGCRYLIASMWISRCLTDNIAYFRRICYTPCRAITNTHVLHTNIFGGISCSAIKWIAIDLVIKHPVFAFKHLLNQCWQIVMHSHPEALFYGANIRFDKYSDGTIGEKVDILIFGSGG